AKRLLAYHAADHRHSEEFAVEESAKPCRHRQVGEEELRRTDQKTSQNCPGGVSDHVHESQQKLIEEKSNGNHQRLHRVKANELTVGLRLRREDRKQQDGESA